ncbi:MAG: amino acid permease [Neisseriales bacterium]|nr:MAG: amino acid permease [Neisseriales bacterium]
MKKQSVPAQESSLHRGLANRHVQMIAISGVIGTGLFLGAGKTISLAGPSIIFVYAIIGFILYFVIRAMGEILLSNLQYKSFLDFIDDILGPMWGFFAGWTYLFSWTVTVIAEIIAVAGFMQFWFPETPAWIPALTCTLVLMGMNLTTVKLFGETGFWFALIKVVAICALIVIGLGFIVTSFESSAGIASFSHIWNHGGFFPKGIFGFLAGFQIAIFTFNGIELLGTTAAETSEPTKTLPNAINTVLWKIVFLYIVTLAVIMSVTPWNMISSSKSPFVGMFMLIGFPAAAGIINFVVLTAAASVGNSGIFSASRMLYGLAEKGDTPQLFRKLSRRAVPANSIYIMSICTLGSAVLMLYFIPNVMEAFTVATSLTAILIMCVWSIIAYTYIVYRKKRPELHEQSIYKMPWGIPMSWIAIGFFICMAVSLAFKEDTRIALEFVPFWFIFLAIICSVLQKNKTK